MKLARAAALGQGDQGTDFTFREGGKNIFIDIQYTIQYIQYIYELLLVLQHIALCIVNTSARGTTITQKILNSHPVIG